MGELPAPSPWQKPGYQDDHECQYTSPAWLSIVIMVALTIVTYEFLVVQEALLPWIGMMIITWLGGGVVAISLKRRHTNLYHRKGGCYAVR